MTTKTVQLDLDLDRKHKTDLVGDLGNEIYTVIRHRSRNRVIVERFTTPPATANFVERFRVTRTLICETS